MANYSDLVPNKIYTFNTKAPAILGASIKNALLLLSCGYETAMTIENVGVKWKNIYPALPNGTPFSPAGVMFHRFKAESGELIFIANEWIQESSIQIVTHVPFHAVFPTASSGDRNSVIIALNTLGIPYTLENL